VPGGDPSRPRLLLVSWHFPPGTSAGALRWEQLAGHAVRRGWELDVLTLDPSELDRRDEDRLEKLPAGTRVFGVRAPEPIEGRLEHALHGIWRSLRGTGRDVEVEAGRGSGGTPSTESGQSGRPSSLARDETRLRPWSAGDLRRAFFAWLEIRRGAVWASEAVHLGRRVARPQTRLVISCGPPHMAHEAGRKLGKALSVPHVMDLRDPWSQVQRLPEHFASPLWYTLSERSERRCVSSAALVVANTDAARDALAAKYPLAADRMLAVMNGYDDEPLPGPGQSGAPARFLVAHAGTVYLDRDPRSLFAAVRKVADVHQAGPDRIGLVFYGCTSDEVRRIAAEEGVEELLELTPFLPRAELARRLVGCPVLVVLPQDSDMAIPSKVFEYLRYPAWVLAMAEPDSATGRALGDTPAAVVGAANVEGLAARLSEWFEAFERGERPPPAARSAPQLSRRAQADLLFDRLEPYREAASSSS
jgi:glycosyltransferase involved in cell wall biosynthesis